MYCRVLPNDLAAAVDVSAWPKPAVFQWLRTTGNVEHRM
jgi:phosphoribosylformylglycinamidine cyclo-ligase